MYRIPRSSIQYPGNTYFSLSILSSRIILHNALTHLTMCVLRFQWTKKATLINEVEFFEKFTTKEVK